jgi:antitoxin VapB
MALSIGSILLQCHMPMPLSSPMASKHRQVAATAERRVKLFRNGRSQYLRIPREWKLPGSKAVVRKDGDRLILTPVPTKTLLAALRRLGPLPERDRMPPIGDFPLATL